MMLLVVFLDERGVIIVSINLLVSCYEKIDRYADRIKKTGLGWAICILSLFILLVLIAALDWVRIAYEKVSILITTTVGICILMALLLIIAIADRYYLIAHRQWINQD